eukprot:TRINITY_DN1885_c0_g1_i2.p1 TRINITY_DN1885_c0_g1~~TRINITY_DN1885_c0_g1_i2.p1  ORF type:complete len:202 (+),score=39.73 TRINITY_DN1885_c0_g1_i2:140-745(+)
MADRLGNADYGREKEARRDAAVEWLQQRREQRERQQQQHNEDDEGEPIDLTSDTTGAPSTFGAFWGRKVDASGGGAPRSGGRVNRPHLQNARRAKAKAQGGFFSHLPTWAGGSKLPMEDETVDIEEGNAPTGVLEYEPTTWDKARWKLLDWRHKASPTSNPRVCCCCSSLCCILIVVIVVVAVVLVGLAGFAASHPYLFAL